ncbi:MAG: ComEC/Rec2 family competence protein [Oscillospiraceae bacterium]|nr:ComEC/Rec2 family competence protein [Oscillospiraceae bacterium]
MTYFLSKIGFTMLFCAFASAFLRPEFSIVFAAISAVIAAGFFFFGKNFYRAAAFFAAAALTFGLTSFKLLDKVYPAAALDGFSAEISGKVTDVSAAGGNPVFTVKTDYVGIPGALQEITVALSGWGENSAEPFDIIKCNVTFHIYSEEDFSETLANRSKGASVYAYLDSPIEITGRDENSPEYFLYLLREKISSVIYKFFVGWHAPFSEQILIGTRGELDYEIISAFRKSGMSHILAISGMHLVIITEIFKEIFYHFKLGKTKLRIKDSFLIVFIMFYMLLGGLGMSLVRSGIMLIAKHLSKLLFSGSKSFDNLGIALIIVLLFDPLASCDVGFLMSVFSCGAISLFSAHFSEYLSRLLKLGEDSKLRNVVSAFSVSTVASLAVIPVAAFAFGEISLAAPFSNLFAGFFARYSIIFALLTVITGFFPFLGFVSGGTAFAAMLCNSFLLKTAEFFAGLSFFQIKAEDFWFFVWLIGAFVLIIVPIVYSGGFRYIRHSVLMSVLVLLAGIILDLVFYSGVSEIKITALEHGTMISCSKNGESVLITRKLAPGDRFDILSDSSDCSVFISIDALSDAAEHDLTESIEPEVSFLSSPDAAERFEGSSEISFGTVSFGEGDFVTIPSEGAVYLETNGATLLYIFGECDIMDIEPKFRRPDILVFDGVSPEKYPVLRSEYLIFRKPGGFYSGTSEIITLKSGSISFFAYNDYLKKGWPAE